jgi:hypothetical protein
MIVFMTHLYLVECVIIVDESVQVEKDEDYAIKLTDPTCITRIFRRVSTAPAGACASSDNASSSGEVDSLANNLEDLIADLRWKVMPFSIAPEVYTLAAATLR